MPPPPLFFLQRCQWWQMTECLACKVLYCQISAGDTSVSTLSSDPAGKDQDYSSQPGMKYYKGQSKGDSDGGWDQGGAGWALEDEKGGQVKGHRESRWKRKRKDKKRSHGEGRVRENVSMDPTFKTSVNNLFVWYGSPLLQRFWFGLLQKGNHSRKEYELISPDIEFKALVQNIIGYLFSPVFLGSVDLMSQLL